MTGTTTGHSRETAPCGTNSASPVTAQGRIYSLNEAGVTFVVEADKKFRLLAKNDLAERALASPAVDEGAIFIRTETKLWRIGRQVGTAR